MKASLTKRDFAVIYDMLDEVEKQIAEEFNIHVRLSFEVGSVIDELRIAGKFQIQAIVKVVCDEYGIEPRDIESKNREGDLPDARHMICKLIKDFFPDTTLKRIGIQLGGRDHSTVLNSIKKFQNHYDTEVAWRKTYHKLYHKLNFIYEQQEPNSETDS